MFLDKEDFFAAFCQKFFSKLQVNDDMTRILKFIKLEITMLVIT